MKAGGRVGGVCASAHACCGQTCASPSQGMHTHTMQVPPHGVTSHKCTPGGDRGMRTCSPHAGTRVARCTHTCTLCRNANWCLVHRLSRSRHGCAPHSACTCVARLHTLLTAHVCTCTLFPTDTQSCSGRVHMHPNAQCTHRYMHAQCRHTCVYVHALLGFACIDAVMPCVSAQLLSSSILSPAQGWKKACLPLPFLLGTYISEVSAHSTGLDSYACPQQGGNTSSLHEGCLQDKGAEST